VPGSDEVIVSGQHDEWYRRAIEYADKLNLTGGKGALGTAGDVELKFAMRMRATGQRFARLIINKPTGPCPGRLGCDELLPRFLPPGATLIVYYPEGAKTYRGRDEPQ